MSTLELEVTQHEGLSHTQAITIIGISAAFLGLSWAAVSLRVYTRTVVIRSFGLDDWLILASLAFFTTQSVIIILLVWMDIHYGITKKMLEYYILEIAFYFCTSIFLKLSLAFFFLRIITKKWQHWVVYSSVTIYTLYSLTFMFVAVFQCGSPADFLVHHLLDECIPWTAMAPPYYIHTTLNAILDWIFAILPMFVVKDIQMSWQSKCSVYFLLSLGAIGSIVSIVRLGYVDGLDFFTDPTFTKVTSIAVTSIIEPGLGMTAISLATLRPLFQRMLGNKSRRKFPPGRTHNKDRSASDTRDINVVGGDNNRLVMGDIDDTEILRTTNVTLTYSTSPVEGDPWSIHSYGGRTRVESCVIDP